MQKLKGSLKILLVEDLDISISHIRESLIKKGYTDISFVKSGEAALEYVRSRTPDCILMDITLEGRMDGIETVKKIQGMADIPVIYTTGSAELAQMARAQDTRPYSYLIKPFKPHELYFAIENAVIRHDLEKTLKKSERRYRALFMNSREIIYIFDIKGHIHDANWCAREFMPEKTVKLNMKDVVLKRSWEQFRLFSTEVYKGGQASGLIFLKNVSGEEIEVEFNAVLLDKKKGIIQAIGRDVGRFRKVEASLRENLEFMRILLNTFPNPVFYKNKKGMYLGCNSRFASQILGMKVDDIIGKSVYDFPDKIPEEQARKYEEKDLELIKSPGVQTYEGPVLCADGVRRVFLFSKATFNDAEGQTAGILGIMIDIEERKKAEESLSEAHKHIESLLSSIAAIIIGVSTKDVVNMWNSMAEDVFGLTSDEVVGKNFMKLKLSWQWERIYQGISETLSSGLPVDIQDLRYTDNKSRARVLNLVINPVRDNNEELKGFIFYGQDVSEKKLLEGQLAQAQKLESIGQLAAGIAHEINTPTQYINDNTTFLKDAFEDLMKYLDGAKDLLCYCEERCSGSGVIERLKKIEKEADINYLKEEIPSAIEQSLQGLSHVTRIVKSMKEFAHPGTDDIIQANVNDLIKNAVVISRNEWKYVADLETEFSDDIPVISCYPNELNQVFLNLILNASQAIEEKISADNSDKGRIVIHTELKTVEDQKLVEIRISDTGCGIPEEVLPRIFDPFFTTKEVGKGTGQGLYISHSVITKKHKGYIFLTSMPGQGTTVTIQLPLEVEGEKA